MYTINYEFIQVLGKWQQPYSIKYYGANKDFEIDIVAHWISQRVKNGIHLDSWSIPWYLQLHEKQVNKYFKKVRSVPERTEPKEYYLKFKFYNGSEYRDTLISRITAEIDYFNV